MMTWLRALSLGLTLAVSACAGPTSAPVVPMAAVVQATSEARQALAPTASLRVGVYAGSPTSLVQNPQTGERLGVTLELGQLLAKQLGVPVQVIEFPRVAEVIEALKREQVDMTFTNASPARARDVRFTRPLVQLELGLLLPPQSTVTRFAQIDQAGLRVGVSQGSSSQAALGQQLKSAQVLPVASLDVAQQMLRSGQLDAFATNKGILFELREKLPGFKVSDDRWGLENLAIAVPKGREAGHAFLDAFAEQVARSGQLAAMAERAGLRGLAKPD
jgi:polar amino acid transport system substrate-binding protein